MGFEKATDSVRVRALLAGLDGLPPMPPVAQRLMALGDLSEADLSEVAFAIELDPALSSGVLGMCRAAHTGLGARVSSVRQAVTMLGVESIRRLVLTASVCETLRDGASDIDERVGHLEGFDREGYWVFCVAVACASEQIARVSGRVASDTAFVAGLLHGIGRFGLELVAPRAVSSICALAMRSGVEAASAERRVLGIDHAQAGAVLAEKWGLGEELCTAIRWSSAPEADESDSRAGSDLSVIVRAARWVCLAYHLGWSGDWSPVGDGAGVLASAGIGGAESGGVCPADRQGGCFVDGLAADVVRSLGSRLTDVGLTRPGGMGEADVGVMIARQANLELEARQGPRRAA